MCGKVNPTKWEEPKRKRVRIERFESHALDPKLDDLTLSSVKSLERGMEARTL